MYLRTTQQFLSGGLRIFSLISTLFSPPMLQKAEGAPLRLPFYTSENVSEGYAAPRRYIGLARYSRIVRADLS